MATFGFETTGKDVVEHFCEYVNGKSNCMVVITGASEKGLGAETAVSLAAADPSQLILLARSAEKVDPVIEKIKKVNPNIEALFVPIELDKLSSITRAADLIKSNPSVKKIDLLINNAGVMATPYRKADLGVEWQLAINHIGPFYLSKQLQPLMAAAGQGARIVNVTSDGYQISSFRFDDYNFSEGQTYDPWSGYGQSKTANILFTRKLAEDLAVHKVYSFAVHPGVIFGTSLGDAIDPSSFGDIAGVAKHNTGVDFVMGNPKSAQQGVATTLVAALDPALIEKSGSLLMDCQVTPALDYAVSLDNAEKLWKLSEDIIGEKWDLKTWA